MLEKAGATVFCTGRSIHGQLSTKGRPETIDDTARMVNEYGGEGIAVHVDHTATEQIRACFERVASEKGGLDILVNNVNGDHLYEWKPFGGGTFSWLCEAGRPFDRVSTPVC